MTQEGERGGKFSSSPTLRAPLPAWKVTERWFRINSPPNYALPCHLLLWPTIEFELSLCPPRGSSQAGLDGMDRFLAAAAAAALHAVSFLSGTESWTTYRDIHARDTLNRIQRQELLLLLLLFYTVCRCCECEWATDRAFRFYCSSFDSNDDLRKKCFNIMLCLARHSAKELTLWWLQQGVEEIVGQRKLWEEGGKQGTP